MSRLKHPVRAIREPYGKAGLTVAVIALVFAMIGGAFAAAGLNGKQKKEVEKIAKKFAGKPGAAGAAGPAGSPGAKGTNGTNGNNGAPGANGKSVVVSAASGAECVGGVGGTKFEIEGSATPGHVCNGAEGEPGEPGVIHPGETLPVGATETGTWGLFGSGAAATELQGQGISFTIPLAAPLGAAEVHFFSEAGFATTCTGSVAEPTAPSGQLCVYGGAEGGTTVAPEGVFTPLLEPGTTEAGALVIVKFEGAGYRMGSWAVTG